MKNADTSTVDFLIFVTPHFNLTTTLAFLDPFRIANYLTGAPKFQWVIVSKSGGEIPTSNGMSLMSQAMSAHLGSKPNVVVVSSSWAPETHQSPDIGKALVQWSRAGAKIGALDTGTFILAKAGLLKGQSATVHYEHIDALIELYPDISVSENLFVVGANRFTCAGGLSSVDLALHILREVSGEGIANATARYMFHHTVRGSEVSQNPHDLEPFGQTTPQVIRRAIGLMEANLETPISIPEICDNLSVSQRQLSRLFGQYVGKTPVLYYRDIRLDRARGLVTQTELKLSEVAVASGFSSQVHFSRAYHDRFGLPPKQDRIDGRVPFEFRPWPMHSPKSG